jgi:hypothetical protein
MRKFNTLIPRSATSKDFELTQSSHVLILLYMRQNYTAISFFGFVSGHFQRSFPPNFSRFLVPPVQTVRCNHRDLTTVTTPVGPHSSQSSSLNIAGKDN